MLILYELLQLNKDADQKEIKDAYIAMLRKYPPEKSPEMFKSIRDAYEILIDPITRAEYDAYSQYKDEIEKLDKLGTEAFNNKDYKTSSKYYKKILLIEPKLCFAKNMLGLSFAHDKKYNEALKQYNELIKINSNNAAYYRKLAYVHKETLNYDEAIKSLKKAHELDPINDETILELVNLYKQRKEYSKAIDFLEACIEKFKTDIFQNFIYFYEILKLFIEIQDVAGVENTLTTIINNMTDDQLIKDYISSMLSKILLEALDNKQLSISKKIIECIMKIDKNKDLAMKMDISLERLYCLLSFVEDDRIIELLRNEIMLEIKLFNTDSQVLHIEKAKNKEEISKNIKNSYNELMNSIRIIKIDYKYVYELDKAFYAKIYNDAKYYKKLYNQWYKIRSDTEYPYNLIKLITLTLFQNEQDEDYKQELKEIQNDIRYDNQYEIAYCINKLEVQYPDLYNLNQEIFNNVLSDYNK